MKQCMSFAKGMGLGVIAGVAAVAAYKAACKNSRQFRKKTGKAARAVSDMMDDIQSLLN